MSHLIPDGSKYDWMTEFVNEAIKEISEESTLSGLIDDLRAIRNDVDVGSWTVRLIRMFLTIRNSHALTFMLSSLCRYAPEVCLTQEIYFVMDAYEILHPVVYTRALNFMLHIYNAIFYCKDRSLVSSNVLNLIMRLYDSVKHNRNLAQRLERFWSIGFICGSERRLEFFLEMRESLAQENYDQLIILIDDYFRSVNRGILTDDEDRISTMRRIAANCLGNNENLKVNLMRFLNGGDERFFHPRGFNLPLVLLISPLENIEQQRARVLPTVNPDWESSQESENFWGQWKNYSVGENFETDGNRDNVNTDVYRPILGRKIEVGKEMQPSNFESSQVSENFWGDWKDFSVGENFETDDNKDRVDTSRRLVETESRIVKSNAKNQGSIRNEFKSSYAAVVKKQVRVEDGGCSTRKDNKGQVGSTEKVKREKNTEQASVARRLKTENEPRTDRNRTPNKEATSTEFVVTSGLFYQARNAEEGQNERMSSAKQGFDVKTEPRKKTADDHGDRESIVEYGCNTKVEEEKNKRDSKNGGELKVKITSGEGSSNNEVKEKSCEEHIVECESLVEKVTEVESVTVPSEKGGSKDETEFRTKNKNTGDSEVCEESNVKSSCEVKEVHDDENAEEPCDTEWTEFRKKHRGQKKKKHPKTNETYKNPPIKTKEGKNTGQPSGNTAFKIEAQIINKEENAGEPSDMEEAKIQTESKTDYTSDQKKTCGEINVKEKYDVESIGKEEGTKGTIGKKDSKVEMIFGLDTSDNTAAVKGKKENKNQGGGKDEEIEGHECNAERVNKEENTVERSNQGEAKVETETNLTERTSTEPTVKGKSDDIMPEEDINAKQSDDREGPKFEAELQTGENQSGDDCKTFTESKVASPFDAEKINDDENTQETSKIRSNVEPKSMTKKTNTGDQSKTCNEPVKPYTPVKYKKKKGTKQPKGGRASEIGEKSSTETDVHVSNPITGPHEAQKKEEMERQSRVWKELPYSIKTDELIRDPSSSLLREIFVYLYLTMILYIWISFLI